jgi:ribose-phosphate pyrophosphokinase
MTADTRVQVFGPEPDRIRAERISRLIGGDLGALETRRYEQGEYRIRPLDDVTGNAVVVVRSLYGDRNESVHDKLCQLLFLTATLRDAGASRVLTVVPHLCYARQDRVVRPRDPIATRYVAILLEASGVDDIISVDPHNQSAFQNAFRCHTVSVEATDLFADHITETMTDTNLVIVSPDIGSIHRAETLRHALCERLSTDIAGAFIEKHRVDGVASSQMVTGEVSGKTAILVDDVIATGATISRAADVCAGAGATSVAVVATHAFGGGIQGALASSAIDRLTITDTIPLEGGTSEWSARVTVLPTADLLAGAIRAQVVEPAERSRRSIRSTAGG